ncbi:hypothetical protein [Chitiniphilus shinanonensis]|uniref:hypothetical protein n=1 Tax=Chitiniphilus shinanonensis TaxID=553088 RepID=UPI0030659B96
MANKQPPRAVPPGPAPAERPAAGGRWLRDPQTGALTRDTPPATPASDPVEG